MINDGIITVSYAVRAPTKDAALDTQLDLHRRDTIAIRLKRYINLTNCCLSITSQSSRQSLYGLVHIPYGSLKSVLGGKTLDTRIVRFFSQFFCLFNGRAK